MVLLPTLAELVLLAAVLPAQAEQAVALLAAVEAAARPVYDFSGRLLMICSYFFILIPMLIIL
jgi:hypothetical protein